MSHPIIRRVVIHAPDDLQDFRIEFPSEGIECFSGERRESDFRTREEGSRTRFQKPTLQKRKDEPDFWIPSRGENRISLPPKKAIIEFPARRNRRNRGIFGAGKHNTGEATDQDADVAANEKRRWKNPIQHHGGFRGVVKKDPSPRSIDSEEKISWIPFFFSFSA